MKQKVLTAILALVLLAVFGAVGSWFASRPAPDGLPPEPPPFAQAEDLLGVIVTVDGNEVSLRFPDGGIDIVRLPEGVSVSAADVGSLARVSGTRDRATRRIDATGFEPWEDAPNLVVTSPLPDSTVTSPLVVFGFGRVFEQTFHWRIRDAADAVVAEGFAMTDAQDTGHFGPFRFEVFLPAMTDPTFSLEVLQFSAKDGRPTDQVRVPLRLLTVETVSFNVYFGNRTQGSNKDCTLVFPLTRTIARTSAVGRAALLEMLAGPTAAERAQGYFTSIPDRVGLNSLSIVEAVATADFDAGLRNVAGSCRVLAIRAQIEETLLQFDSVGEVVISVEGDVAEALQP